MLLRLVCCLPLPPLSCIDALLHALLPVCHGLLHRVLHGVFHDVLHGVCYAVLYAAVVHVMLPAGASVDGSTACVMLCTWQGVHTCAS